MCHFLAVFVGIRCTCYAGILTVNDKTDTVIEMFIDVIIDESYFLIIAVYVNMGVCLFVCLSFHFLFDVFI